LRFNVASEGGCESARMHSKRTNDAAKNLVSSLQVLTLALAAAPGVEGVAAAAGLGEGDRGRGADAGGRLGAHPWDLHQLHLGDGGRHRQAADVEGHADEEGDAEEAPAAPLDRAAHLSHATNRLVA
jgi:hypothetical protein